MDFLTLFNNAKEEFTYVDEDNEDLTVLQVGLVAIFYFEHGAQKRQGIVQDLDKYLEYFGEHLKWGYFSENMKNRQPTAESFEACRAHILENPEGQSCEFLWSSQSPGWEYVGDYAIDSLAAAGWKEPIHQNISTMRFSVPVSVLEGDGAKLWQQLILDCCQYLKPLNGLSGLGIQQCQEDFSYQDLEYDITKEFKAIDVNTLVTTDNMREGYRSVNWYTFLADSFIDQLGGLVELQRQFLRDPEVEVLPYEGGAMIRAGEWPELGWVKDNPYPEAYVKVDRVLRPVRLKEVGSFHNGSIEGEIRFDKKTSNEWLRRFDHVTLKRDELLE